MTSNGKRPGALVVGGEHPGLGIVRSLGRKGIPVYVLDDQYCISSFSRFATRSIKVPDLRDERRTIDAVLEVGRKYDLRDWVLFPTRDETVAAFSRYRDELAEFYKVTTPEWNTVKWAWDKKNTYDLATELDIPCPRTFNPHTVQELAPLHSRLPLAIKPAVKENFFYTTGAKAWRADTPEQLHRLFTEARRRIRPEEILIQEIIPGDGNEQFSYCAFYLSGHAHSTLVARRGRQHPREFGRAATYVESVDLPLIEALSHRFLKKINYYGLVEIEYKRDPRDGLYKLLDVNARTWGFHTLGLAAGVDFPYLLFADQVGDPAQPCRGKAGVGWLRFITDGVAVMSELFDGKLNMNLYLQSLGRTKVESVFCKEDPVPFFAEVALLPYWIVKKY